MSIKDGDRLPHRRISTGSDLMIMMTGCLEKGIMVLSNRCLSKRQIHNHISHFDVLVPKDRKHLIQVLRIFHVQKGYTQLVAEFPHNLCV